MANSQNFKRWDDSATKPADVTGSTSFGYFDNDQHFINDAPNVASWIARQLGYPVVDVEITPDQIYDAIEDAVIEYGAEVNRFNIRENLPHLQGEPLSTDVTGKNIQKTSLNWSIELSDSYGAEVGAGGDVDWKKESIELEAGKQKYDLDKLISQKHENFKEIEIKRIFHSRLPASRRDYYHGGFLGSGGSNYGGNFDDVLGEFGFDGLGVGYGNSYLLFPLSEELGRTQHVELYDKMRRSQYSFRIINNKLEIFPRPTSRNDGQNLWIEYIVKEDRSNQLTEIRTNSWNLSYTSSLNNATGSVSASAWNYSNVSYNDINFNNTVSKSLAEVTGSLSDLTKINARFGTAFDIDTQNIDAFVPSLVNREDGFNHHFPQFNSLAKVDIDNDGQPDFYDVSMIVTRLTGSEDRIATGSNLVSSSDTVQVKYNYVEEKQSEDVISDYSNVPYDVIPYKNINSPGRQWIKKYALANTKIIVGEERSKYQSIPIPNDNVSLNGDTLKSEGRDEIQQLVEKLRTDLEETTRRSQLERAAEESKNLQDSLKNVPLPIFVE